MEIVDKFDNKRTFLNKTSDRYENIAGEYRQSVHVWIKNSDGKFLIQKRSQNKRSHPNMWAQTGGAVDANELPLDAMIRETKEELGVTISRDDTELVLSFKREHDFVDIFLVKKDLDISQLTLQEEEVQEVKWVTMDEIKDLYDKNLFVPSINLYIDTFIKLIEL